MRHRVVGRGTKKRNGRKDGKENESLKTTRREKSFGGSTEKPVLLALSSKL